MGKRNSRALFLLLPKLFVRIDTEVIFVLDCKLLLWLLGFSLFLPGLSLFFRQTGQIDGHLVKHKNTKLKSERTNIS